MRTRAFLDKLAALERTGEPFAVATVVGRRAPVSAHLGDRAIVYADGRMDGFVGGACSREIVRTQALESLRARHARLVSIRPDAGGADRPDREHVTVSMTCASEGAVDVYIEPILPPRRLVIVGATPVAEALARLGRAIDYDVVRVVERGERRDIEADAAALGITVAPLDTLKQVLEGAPDGAIVVASQGHYDEEALEIVLNGAGTPYVGLVASRKRAAKMRTTLEGNGGERMASVRYPAGIDLGARTAPEVALSILAEIVQQRPSATADAGTPREEAAAVEAAPATAVDPVCGMAVTIATAKHQAEVEGRSYYFCCPHCRAHFLKDPQGYLAARP